MAADDRRIHLKVESEGRSLLLRLCDHGPGIADSERGRMFRPFTKSASEAAHSAPGVGLGLALCRRLAKQIGGRLWLEPANGDGACFVLKLPG
jgi:signal transduction histidine kinase